MKRWTIAICVLLLAFAVGCSAIFTSDEDRGPSPDHNGGNSADDDTDDDTDDDADDDTDDDTDDDISEVDAVLVYDYDSSIPSDFGDWADDYSIKLDSYKVSDILDVDLGNYDIVIIGEDLDLYGYHYAAFNHINDSGKPLIGIYEGNSFYTEEGTYWYNFETANCPVFDWEQNLELQNTDDSVFDTPFEVQTAGTLQITVNLKPTNACHSWNMPTSVVALGALTSPYADYVSIAYEPSKSAAFWGFKGTPADLTTDAKKLLANLVHHVSGNY